MALTETTAALLTALLPICSVCAGPTAGSHRFRYIACHPEGTGAEGFLAAFEAGDWAGVQARQLPAVGRPILAVYAVACPLPAAAGAGVVALLGADGDVSRPGRLIASRALPPDRFTALRALCPYCEWLLV